MEPMRKTLMLCLLCCTIAGSQSSWPAPGTSTAARRPENPGRPFAEGIELAATDAGLEQGQVATKFNFVGLRDLWVRVKVHGVRRFTRVTLSFVDPSGNVFFEDYLTFSPDADQAPGPPPGTVVHPAKKLAGGFALDHPIAIDGTNFTRFPQPGMWQVRARIGDARRTFTSPLEVVFQQED
jgi:hypothetical protein